MNIANMTKEQQRHIEIEKHAALLIWKLRRNIISRGDILLELENSDNKEALRAALNKFKGMR